VRIIDRYLVREIVAPFALGLAVFTSILLIVRILKLVELVVNRGVPLVEIVKLFAYILPAFLEVTVPMALLLAILVAFGRMSSDSEIVALQASGVAFLRLLYPVALFAVAVTGLALVLSIWVRPWGNSHLRTGLYEIVKARASAGIKPQIFNDDFSGLVIYVDRIEPPGNDLQGILIADSRDPRQRNTVYARSGSVMTNEDAHSLTLRLLDGGIYTAAEAGGGYQATRFTTYDVQLDLNVALADVSDREKDPSEMTLGELRAAIARRFDAGDPAYAERVELHRKFAIPFACLVLAALGAPLGIRPSRAVHSRGFMVSLVLIFAYYLLLTLGHSLGERGILPPLLASWLPNLGLSAVAAVLLFRTVRDTRVTRPALPDLVRTTFETQMARLRARA